MRTEGSAWYLGCAALVLAQSFALAALPYEIAEPWNSLWHLLAYSGVTLLALVATDCRRPLAVVLAVSAIGVLDELVQGAAPGRSAELLDVIAIACAAALTAAVLAHARKGVTRACVESSEQ
jgi:VanZ family protein